jgi:hypothetical protein
MGGGARSRLAFFWGTLRDPCFFSAAPSFLSFPSFSSRIFEHKCARKSTRRTLAYQVFWLYFPTM